MSRKMIGIVCLILLAAEISLGHGEDMPGPHGGLIRMPGAFHTEIVPSQKTLDVYLLDINWDKPMTKESEVLADIHINAKTYPLSCKAKSDKFVCSLPPGIRLDKGELRLQAKRQGVPGAEMKYSLPLEIPKTNKHKHH